MVKKKEIRNYENREPIYLDQEGYNKFLKEIEGLKEKLIETSKEKGLACSEAAGDGWHDNFAFEEASRQEDALISQINEHYERLARIKIISRSEDDTIVDIGDIVRINLIYDKDDMEEIIVKLTGSYGVVIGDEMHEITIDSPMGRAIYHKKVGDTAYYSVNGKFFDLEIKEKIKEKQKVLKNEIKG